MKPVERRHIHGTEQNGACVHAQTMVYPQMHRFIMHPCASGGTARAGCGEFASATSMLRFESFFTQRKVVVTFTFEVRPLPSKSSNWAHSNWISGLPRRTAHACHAAYGTC